MGHLFLQPEQVHLCSGVSTSAADQSWGPGAFVGQLDSEQTLQVHTHTHKLHTTSHTNKWRNKQREVYILDIYENPFLYSVAIRVNITLVLETHVEEIVKEIKIKWMKAQ